MLTAWFKSLFARWFPAPVPTPIDTPPSIETLERLRQAPTDPDLEMWDLLHEQGLCPGCGAKDSMLEGPSGGMAVNLICSQCHRKYWTSGIRGFGTKEIGVELPDSV